MDFLKDLLPVIITFAIFMLPELLKSKRRSQQKYEYPKLPEEHQPVEPSAAEEDILDCKLRYTPQKFAAHSMTESHKSAESYQTAEQPNSGETAARLTRRLKLTKAQAQNGLVMAEILGKPRALRPLERWEGPRL